VTIHTRCTIHQVIRPQAHSQSRKGRHGISAMHTTMGYRLWIPSSPQSTAVIIPCRWMFVGLFRSVGTSDTDTTCTTARAPLFILQTYGMPTIPTVPSGYPQTLGADCPTLALWIPTSARIHSMHRLGCKAPFLRCSAHPDPEGTWRYASGHTSSRTQSVRAYWHHSQRHPFPRTSRCRDLPRDTARRIGHRQTCRATHSRHTVRPHRCRGEYRTRHRWRTVPTPTSQHVRKSCSKDTSEHLAVLRLALSDCHLAGNTSPRNKSVDHPIPSSSVSHGLEIPDAQCAVRHLQRGNLLRHTETYLSVWVCSGTDSRGVHTLRHALPHSASPTLRDRRPQGHLRNPRDCPKTPSAGPCSRAECRRESGGESPPQSPRRQSRSQIHGDTVCLR